MRRVLAEIRVGPVGLPRLIPDYHAVSVTSAILGGLFNSRLNRKLREEKGYTYGAGAGFDMRRGAGPFAVRAAVNTGWSGLCGKPHRRTMVHRGPRTTS